MKPVRSLGSRAGKENRPSMWATAYEQHAPAIRAYLYRRVPGREEAEDLLQETFARAMRAEAEIRHRVRLRSYLFSIAHNLLVNYLRRERGRWVRESELESDADDGEAGLSRLLPADGASTDHAVEHRDLRERLDGELAKLREHHRRAFVLAVLEDLSYAEIEARTGWSRSQVKINVFRARRQIIERMSEFLPEQGEK